MAVELNSRVKRRAKLLCGVSLRTYSWCLLAAGATATLAGAVQSAAGGSLRGISIPSNAATAASQVATANSAAAAAAAAKQAAALSAAARALQGMQQTQNLARGTFLLNMPNNLGRDPRNPGQQLPNVPDGLTPGGLSYDAAAIGKDPTLWQGAKLPTQFNDGGKVTVDIKQTNAKAILNWQTFNIGANTTLNFEQGGSDWIALNRVAPGGSSPSQILGAINAPGSVYIINQNGIVFGAGSQVNLHSLVASSLDVGDFGMTRAQRDQFFLNNGIASQLQDAAHKLVSSFSSTLDPGSSQVDGDVVVQPGARITANPAGPGQDDPGFVYLFGPNVTNRGTISAPIGEVALVAGQGIAIVPKLYDAAQNGIVPDAAIAKDLSVPIRGSGFSIYARRAKDDLTIAKPYQADTGQVTNDGLISTPGGSTILNGDQITMSGVISADSGINRNSQVFLDAVTRLDLSGTISVLPLHNGDTPLPIGSTSSGQSSVTAFSPPSIGMSAFQVNLGPTALISAPGASVTISGIQGNFGDVGVNFSRLDGATASERVVMQAGAVIDVSGLRNIELPATYNIVSFSPRGTEFADQPLQRDGIVFGQLIHVDLRNRGVRSDGSTWIGTPLLDASGFVGLVGRSIDQLLTTGGTVSFRTELSKGGLVDLQHGSSINVAGGSVTYLPGYVPITRLIGSDGRIYNISDADPNLKYVGIYGQYIDDHPHWSVTNTFLNPFGQIYQAGYAEGHDAGGISVRATTPQLNADLQFGAQIGMRQAMLGLSRSGTANGVSSQGGPEEIPSQGFFSLVTPQSVVVSDGVIDYGNASFQSRSPESAVQLSAQQYSGYGLSSINVTANDLYVPAGSSLALAPGGSFTAATAGAIDVQGSIVARGGQINLATKAYSIRNDAANLGRSFLPSITSSGQSDIVIGGLLDTRGLWVNDLGTPTSLLGGPGFINGGAITIQTFDSDTATGGPNGATGSIILSKGSVLDASSGGYVDQRGSAKASSSGILAGSGGNITIATFQTTGDGFKASPDSQVNLPDAPQADALVKLGGSLRSFGFTSGGMLTLQSPAFQIGGTPSSDANVVNLASAFFAQGGFGAYVLQSPKSTGGVFARTIALAENETLRLRQSNYDSVTDYRTVPTGADIAQFAPLTILTDNLRKPVNLTLQSDNLSLGKGSLIAADPLAKISLVGLETTSTVQIGGAIVDHGGTVTVNAANVLLGPQAAIDLSGVFVANPTFGQIGGASQSGNLLPGGSIAFDTAKAGAGSTGVLGQVIADAGASINVDGAQATIAALTSPGGALPRPVFPFGGQLPGAWMTTVPSWSDAGKVGVNTDKFVWNGSFSAEAGNPQGNRGTLMLGGNAIALVPSMKGLATLPTASIVAAADQLAAFDTVYLYAGAYDTKVGVGGLGFFNAATPLPSGVTEAPPATLTAPLRIYGDVDLNVGNRLYVEADQISGDGNSRLSANYVLLARNRPATDTFVPASGPASLTISARTIDVQSSLFTNFATVAFKSEGDIRLASPPVNDGVQNGQNIFNPTTFFGQIVAGGDLAFSARRIYPVSAVDFEIVSTAAAGTVSFSAASTGSDTSIPLSAGGSLTVSANTIIQNGSLFAPLGKITLGTLSKGDLSPNDTRGAFVPTAKVILGAGSLTSTSLGGLTVPYGQTEDSTNWFYNADVSPLKTLPTKVIRLAGSTVSQSSSATIDLTGGGDLLAFEFVQGKGGSRDVLSSLKSTGPSTRPTYANPAVYAIIPGNQPDVGAFDIHFKSYLGDKQPLAGQQVYLDGANGIPAGWYTLYPSHYATLPGAYRVVDYGSALANPTIAKGTTLADGTQLISGYFGQSSLYGRLGAGPRASGAELFSVQAESVWRLYSEISPNKANTYFSQGSHRAPVLPNDGGRLAIIATGTFDLSATIRSQPGAGGRGGQLDISAAKIDVVDPDATPLTGYTALNAVQVDKAGFASVLIGGLRTDQSDGTILITPTATDVRVDLARSSLYAPEIILVAAPSNTSVKVPVRQASTKQKVIDITLTTPDIGSGNVTIATGSIVTATGDTGADSGRSYVLGSSAPYTASSLAAYLGGTLDTTGGTTLINGVSAANLEAKINAYAASTVSGAGALLLVSNAPQVSVARRSSASIGPVTVLTDASTNLSIVLPDPAPGTVSIQAGAQVGSRANSPTGQPQSLIVSATAAAGGIQIDPDASIGARSLTLSASSIAVGDNVTADVASSTGLLISQRLLPQLSAANSLALQTFSRGIDFYGFQAAAACGSACPIRIGDGQVLRNLTLDASALVGHGTDVRLSAANTLTLVNSGAGAPSTAPVKGGGLLLDAGEIDLGGGNANIAGFGAVTMAASERVLVKGAGSLAIGADATPVDLTVFTPGIVVGAGSSGGAGVGSQFGLSTLGHFVLRGTGAVPAPTAEIGGNLKVTAASIELDQATIQAVSGKVALRATGSTAGNILLGDRSLISAPGYAEVFTDLIKYAPGGRVVLTSDNGDILMSATSAIDLSQPAGGIGSGGELDIIARNGNLVSGGGLGILDAAIAARGGVGRGGSFRLDIKGGLAGNSLDALADKLMAGGFFGDLDIHTRTGGMVLGAGHLLAAHSMVLTADESDPVFGRVAINEGAMLDASGATAGSIEIYARSIDLFGALYARATDFGQSGGSVVLGIAGTASGQTDATYGYEILNSGSLTIGPRFSLDLSRGPSNPSQSATYDGVHDGKLTARVPLRGGGSGVDVVVQAADTRGIKGVRDVIVEAYGIWSTADATSSGQHFDGIIDPAGTSGPNPADHQKFYQQTLVNFVQNALDPVASATPAIDTFLTNSAALPAGTAFHLRPGIELRNPLLDAASNNGDITVASAWNLAAGTMSNLRPYVYTGGSYNYFDPATSAIAFKYRYGVEPGALTLRATGSINVNASITDGFYDYQNLSDPRYASSFNFLGFSPGAGGSTPAWSALPPAPVPTDPTANTISPGATSATPLASYDLFPNSLNIVTAQGTRTVHPDSWSYRLAGGADLASASPNAVSPLSIYGDSAAGVLAGRGNVIVDKHTTYTYNYVVPSSVSIGSVALPTMLRTGTGDIAINAVRDLILADHAAPGVIYSAGRNSELLPSAAITNIGTASAPVLVVGNPDGFVEPNILAYADLVAGRLTNGGLGAITELGKTTGPPTAAAFPVDGGNIVINVQQDILGWQNVTTTTLAGVSGQKTLYQFYAPWMLSQAAGSSGAGAFAAIDPRLPPQTAWWIEFGRFDQGVLSAGGNITVTAGRDVKDLSVSLPTTGRVSGGLTVLRADGSLNIPVTHLYRSGNMTVRVGGELDSGAFYEGSGNATISVAGAVRSDWSATVNGGTVPVSTVLAVDTGQISLTAGGSVLITDIINPTEIHASSRFGGSTYGPVYMDAYGPNSAVRLTSVAGNVTINAIPQLLSNDRPGQGFPVTQTYPAIVEVTALGGSITTPQAGMILTDSPSATLDLVAKGSIDLRGGVVPTPTTNFGSIIAGTALIDAAFNPYEPNLGDDPRHPTWGNKGISTPVLAHSQDPAGNLYDHIYAATGDIIGAFSLATQGGLVEIPRPVLVRAGRDIVDLNLTAQNIRITDVSQIVAGRDIRYDNFGIGGGLQIAGPGFLDVEAGRNLGPFLPASADTATGTVAQQGIVSSGNKAQFISLTTTGPGLSGPGLVASPVGNNVYGKTIGIPSALFLGSSDANSNYRGQRNFLLPAEGASIVALFGVAPGIDYQAVIDRYINPATATSGHNHLGDLQPFLGIYWLDARTSADLWSKWSSLSPLLQQMFVDQVFFSELKGAATSKSVQDGFVAINTMFPAALGYTRNAVGSGRNGAPRDQLVRTGDFNLLHATIQTQLGGDVRLFGPGGDIQVGSLATEPNANLKLNNLGLLTLGGGGIYSFTDGSVLVNSSRVFTELGGSIIMWSSNADLDAGRGSRTTASLNALTVNIDNNDYQSVDRGGLVTGAGISTLQASKDVAAADVVVFAPNGTVDAGDAGIRSSGSVSIFASQVLNAGNVSAGGSVTSNQAVAAPSLGGLTSASSTTAAGTRTTAPETTGSTPKELPSIVIVEVIGYGGGDGDANGSTSADAGRQQ